MNEPPKRISVVLDPPSQAPPPPLRPPQDEQDANRATLDTALKAACDAVDRLTEALEAEREITRDLQDQLKEIENDVEFAIARLGMNQVDWEIEKLKPAPLDARPFLRARLKALGAGDESGKLERDRRDLIEGLSWITKTAEAAIADDEDEDPETRPPSPTIDERNPPRWTKTRAP